MVSSSLLPNSAQPREVCFPATRAKVPNYKVVGLYKSRSTHSAVLIFMSNSVYLDTFFLYIEIITISKHISFYVQLNLHIHVSSLLRDCNRTITDYLSQKNPLSGQQRHRQWSHTHRHPRFRNNTLRRLLRQPLR